MNAAPTQTEAQRLAALIGRYRSPHCGEAAALLLRQDELLERALDVLEWYGNNYWAPATAKETITAIRAHREAT